MSAVDHLVSLCFGSDDLALSSLMASLHFKASIASRPCETILVQELVFDASYLESSYLEFASSSTGFT